MSQNVHDYATNPTGPHRTEEPMAREDIVRRFKVIGATEKEADALADTQDDQYVVSVSNQDLQLILDAHRDKHLDVEGSTAKKLEEWVGDDPERASLVLAAERARGDDARSTVITNAEKIAAKSEAAEGEASEGAAE